MAGERVPARGKCALKKKDMVRFLVVWVLQEADTEIEISMQDVY